MAKKNLVQRTSRAIRKTALKYGMGDEPYLRKVEGTLAEVTDNLRGHAVTKKGEFSKKATEFKPTEKLFRKTSGMEFEPGSPLRDFHKLARLERKLGKTGRAQKGQMFEHLAGQLNRPLPSGRPTGTPHDQLSPLDRMARGAYGRIAGAQSTKAWRANHAALVAQHELNTKNLRGMRRIGKQLKVLSSSVKVAGHTVAAATAHQLYKNPAGRMFDVAGTGKYIPQEIGGTLTWRNLLGVGLVGYGSSKLYHWGMPKDDPYGMKRYRDPYDNPRHWTNRPYFDRLPGSQR
jgi:hypothetical protein